MLDIVVRKKLMLSYVAFLTFLFFNICSAAPGYTFTPPVNYLLAVGQQVFEIISLAEKTALERVPELIQVHSPRVRTLDKLACYWALDFENWPPPRKYQEVHVTLNLKRRHVLFVASTTGEVIVRIQCPRANQEFIKIKKLLGDADDYPGTVWQRLYIDTSKPGLIKLKTGFNSQYSLHKHLQTLVNAAVKTVLQLKEQEASFVIADTGKIFPLLFATIPHYENIIGKWGILTAPYQLLASRSLAIEVAEPLPGFWGKVMTYGHVKAKVKRNKLVCGCELCLYSTAVWYTVRNAIYAARRKPVLVDPKKLLEAGYINNKPQDNQVLPQVVYGDIYRGYLRYPTGGLPEDFFKDRVCVRLRELQNNDENQVPSSTPSQEPNSSPSQLPNSSPSQITRSDPFQLPSTNPAQLRSCLSQASNNKTQLRELSSHSAQAASDRSIQRHRSTFGAIVKTVLGRDKQNSQENRRRVRFASNIKAT